MIMGFRKTFINWIISFVWRIVVIIIFNVFFIITAIIGLLDLILSPITLIISLIFDKNVMMAVSNTVISFINDKIFKPLDRFEKKHIDRWDDCGGVYED